MGMELANEVNFNRLVEGSTVGEYELSSDLFGDDNFLDRIIIIMAIAVGADGGKRPAEANRHCRIFALKLMHHIFELFGRAHG